MKIQQMAFMVIAVMLFFALVGMLILTVKFQGLKEQATNLAEKNAMLLVTKLANSPEFSCGNAFGNSRVSCVDFEKAMILKENAKAYENFWGVSNIEIRKIYPTGEIICDKSNYPNCNIVQIISEETKGISVGNFVALCRKEFDGVKTYDKCELAKLLVSYKEVK